MPEQQGMDSDFLTDVIRYGTIALDSHNFCFISVSETNNHGGSHRIVSLFPYRSSKLILENVVDFCLLTQFHHLKPCGV